MFRVLLNTAHEKQYIFSLSDKNRYLGVLGVMYIVHGENLIHASLKIPYQLEERNEILS